MRAGLLNLPGVGEWTAEYLLLRAIGWPDAFPAGDLGLVSLSVIPRPEKGRRLGMVEYPLRMREDRLKAILKEVQRSTKTSVPGSSEPFTLDMLRAQLNKRR